MSKKYTVFEDMTEDEQDEVARAKIKEILSKPELKIGDTTTVAACVTFIGTSQKMADKFSQALLDTAESLIQGLCVRCGQTPGRGPSSCLICQGIKNVRALKLEVKSDWTDGEVRRLEANLHLKDTNMFLLSKIVGRSQKDIEVRLREMGQL